MKKEDLYYFESIREMSERESITKKEVVECGAQAAQKMLDEGWHDAFDLLATSARNKEFWSAFDTTARQSVSGTPEKTYKLKGCEFSMRNTGDRLDYANDPVYLKLHEELKAREDLLKLAYKAKQPIHDELGFEVPKVGIKTYGKETLNVKF